MENQHSHEAGSSALPDHLRQTEFVGSRLKATLLLLVSLVFLSIFLLAPYEGDHRLRWEQLFSFGASVICVVLLVRPPRLSLDQDGFIVSGWLIRSPKKIAWGDVTGFFVVRLRGRSVIGFNYSADAPNRPRLAAVSRIVGGADDMVRGVWRGSNAAIVEKLNAYRQWALQSDDSLK